MSSQKIVKLIQSLAYGLVVLIPLVYFPTGMFPFQIIKTIIFQILVEILFVLWLALVIFDKNFRPKFTPTPKSLVWGFTPIAIALLIFISIISLSVIFGSDWRAGLWSDEQRTLGLVAVFHFIALFFVLSSINQNQFQSTKNNFWRNLWFLSFGTAVVVSLIGISQKFLFFPREFNMWLHILYPEIPLHAATPERVGSTFGNPSFMAGYLLFNFFIGLYLFASQKTRINADKKLIYADKSSISINRQNQHKSAFQDKLRRINMDYRSVFLITGTLLILIAIFLSQTLGVILGLGMGIFTLLLCLLFNKNNSIQINISKLRKLSIGLLILILVFVGVFWLTRSNSFWQKIPGLSRLSQATLESQSIRDRLITWQISLKAFKEKPILGWGFENFRIAFSQHYDPRLLTQSIDGTYWDKPHNVLLEYLTNTGILGLLSYLGIFAAAFYILIKKFKTSDNFYAFPLFFSIIIAYFVQNLFIFDTIGTYLMFFLLLAFINPKSESAQIIADNNRRTPKNLPIFVSVFLLISFVPIYYNYQIFNASRYEYWGANYFLNTLIESSLVSFNRALKTPTPYIDDIRKNFASTVQQAFQQGIEYPNLKGTQAKLVEELKLTIERHPEDFFNYITLAEFENTFSNYNPNYLDEAEGLSQKALELSPNRQQIYYVLAKTRLLKGDIKSAYEIFEKVIALNPQAGDPHFYFGLIAYEMGNYQKGASEIAEAERLGRLPKDFKEAVALGNFVGDYEHNYKKSIELYKLALDKMSDNINKPDVLLKLAVAYYFDNNKEQSRQTFLELKKLVDLKKIPIYPQLQPILEDLKIDDQ